MFAVDIESEIIAPIEQVFNRIIDLDGYSEWLPRQGCFFECQETKEGPVGTGTTFIDRTRIGM